MNIGHDELLHLRCRNEGLVSKDVLTTFTILALIRRMCAAAVPKRYAQIMATIAPDEAGTRLKEMPGWTKAGNAIQRQFTFAGFPEAVAFVVRVGFAAEAVDHHPDLLINYKRVTVTYSTHTEGGLTGKDFDGAREATTIATALGGK
jgi:4a-hydroxytetrahydrobiopterin dehydratase